MRGIMIHSLIGRGVPFEDAIRCANAVRQRLRPQGVVDKAAIRAELAEQLGPSYLERDHSLPRPVDIAVLGKGGVRPFSKGVLSQSLLAAALEPGEAFEVARDIERELLRRELRQIERQDLRRITYDAVCRRAGQRTGERYLVWRRYAEPERPVILLIGGAAGVGKTSLALEVAHRLGIRRVLSTDSIRQIMRLMLSPELAPAIHGSSYDAHTHFPTGALGSDPMLEAFRMQAATVSVGVKASIERAIDENASTVIDGVALVPGALDLAAYAGRADVIFLVVTVLDREAYATRFTSRARGAAERSAHKYLENLDAILRIQEQFLEAADRHRIPIVDNDHFDRAVLLVLRHLTEALRERPEFDPSELL